jgi:predicted TIM-barrel fold metal-dependent hydrolase
MIIIPLWDPPAAAVEIERCAALGARALAFSENPAPLGLPTVQNPQRYWDPVWAAAEAAELVVCMHVGSSSTFPAVSPESPFLVTHAWATGSLASGTMVEWLLSPVFQRFPKLKIALSEGGIGWIPYFLEHAEQTLERHSAWASKLEVRGNLQTGEAMSLSASEVDFRNLDVRQSFRDHVYGCFIEDAHGIASLDTIGVDNVMIETDYPHSDSSWPNCIDLAHKQLAGLSPADAYKVLRGNAERVFRFTPADPPVAATR